MKFSSLRNAYDLSDSLLPTPVMPPSPILISSEDEPAGPSKRMRPTSRDSPLKERPRKFYKVVRKKAERAKLKATACASCVRYYNATGLDEEEKAKLLQEIGRHRDCGRTTPDLQKFWALEITGSVPMEETPSPPRAYNKYMRKRE